MGLSRDHKTLNIDFHPILIMFCIFSSWKPEDFFALGSLIVSILTLCLGYIAYKRLLVPEARKRQLDLVLNLISLLERVSIQISEAYPRPKPDESATPGQDREFRAIGRYNLFELANLPKFKKNLEVFVPNSAALFENEYFKDPLMPSDMSLISERLKKIPVTSLKTLDDLKNFPKEYYSLGWDVTHALLVSDGCSEIKGGINTLLNECVALRDAIIKWLHTYGVTDTNSTILRKIRNPS